MKCDDCVYAEITAWETDLKTKKAMPILWCEKHRKHCEDVNVKCEYYDDAKRQTGEWINTGVDEEWYARAYECSLCGHTMVGTANYCPNCGDRKVRIRNEAN